MKYAYTHIYIHIDPHGENSPANTSNIHPHPQTKNKK